MTAEEFNSLEKDQQRFLLCDADKISENTSALFKEELFKIENVFIEVKMSNLNRCRRQIKAYTSLPLQMLSPATEGKRLSKVMR